MGKIINAHGIQSEKGNTILSKPGRRWEDNIKMYMSKREVRMRSGFFGYGKLLGAL
jgi:hypothetical protein